jgi:NAD(P)-dependent dehydrogenase (short-subunit alcohol dehydrogenase family)
MHMGRVQDSVAIVTGASSGHGRAIALALAGEGAKLVCADLRRDPRPEGNDGDQPTDDVITSNGGEAIFVETNVTDSSAVDALFATTVEQFGRVDVLVNNAGVFLGVISITDDTEEQFDLTIAVNLKAPWLCSRAAIKQMQGQDQKGFARGRIINISSVASLVGQSDLSTYSASKGGNNLLTKSLAIECAKHRINVNAVAPGYLHTAMAAAFFNDPEVRAGVESVHPWPEMGGPRDIAQAVLFLASEEARWITGAILPVDGGMTAD